jgi:hypothetical protein
MKENRSIFWPLVLFATGLIWLLVSIGTIPAANLWALTHLWPLLLMALGAGLILRAFWKPAGMIVSALVVVAAILAVVFAPQLGWNNLPAWTNWHDGGDFSGSVKGSGEFKTETRDVQDFNAIAVNYPAEIVIRQGEKESVTITADDNLLPQMSSDVRGSTLYIENTEHNWNERVIPTKPVKITIVVVSLKEIHFSSAGSLSVEEVKSDELAISISGAGNLHLVGIDVGKLTCRLSGAGDVQASGKADQLELRISGIGNFDGADLESQSAEVHISGAGDVTVWTTESLDASISGAGSVNYYGDPSVNQRISGAGSVNGRGSK